MLRDFGDVSVLLPIKARCVAEAILKDEFPQQLLLGLSEFDFCKHSNSPVLEDQSSARSLKMVQKLFLLRTGFDEVVGSHGGISSADDASLE